MIVTKVVVRYHGMYLVLPPGQFWSLTDDRDKAERFKDVIEAKESVRGRLGFNAIKDCEFIPYVQSK